MRTFGLAVAVSLFPYSKEPKKSLFQDMQSYDKWDSVVLLRLSYEASFNCDNSAIDDNIRNVFLDFHNDGRRRIAKGLEPNVNGKKLNKAANMVKLRWSCDMEAKAQEYVKSCNAPGGMVGPYYGVVWNLNGHAALKEVVGFSLKMSWSAVSRNPVPDTNEYTVCALQDFSQMANARATEIGCTVNRCGNKMQIVCLYNAVGNLKGQPMWETGEPCSECIGNATCEDGLCVRPEEKPDDGKNTICSNEGMTDKVRTRILDLHNEFRSLVAKGLAKNGTMGYAPKASNMYKLKYHCDLEQKAVTFASNCIYRHSDDHHRPDIGENIFRMTIPKADKTMAAENAIVNWFYELKKYGIFPENRFTRALNDRPKTVVAHYTQMVWATTKYVGCGVQNCAKETIVVCNYSPMGNTIDQMIYELGAPCSKCPGGSTCSETEGLCVFSSYPFFNY